MLEPRIAQYLAHRIPEAREIAVQGLYRIPGGQSRETWSFDARWRENGSTVERGFILRRDPDASVLVSDRDLEFRVMEAVGKAGVPVPQMYWLEPEESWLDRPFCLMARIDDCEANPTNVLMGPSYFPVRPQLAEQFTDILAKIHAADWRALGLDFLRKPPSEDACGVTEVEEWEAVLDREAMEPQPVLRAAFRWLRKNPPKPAQRIVLVHADYRTGNFLAHPSGEIRGILDWEMTHLGDPLEDIGWACARPWRWLGNEQVGGLMDRDLFYRRYEEQSGFRIDDDSVRFWEIVANIKLAIIFLTGGRSFIEGRTRAAMMAFLGRNTRRLELEIMDLMGV